MYYRDVPGVDASLLPVVKKVLKTFSVLSYGDFDEFDVLRNITELPRLRNLNITEMLLKVYTVILCLKTITANLLNEIVFI